MSDQKNLCPNYARRHAEDIRDGFLKVYVENSVCIAYKSAVIGNHVSNFGQGFQ